MLSQEKPRPRAGALMGGIEVIGDLLVLQLLFLLSSIPLVSIVPAAVALQRALRKTVIEKRPGLARTFFREFAWAWTRTWAIGLVFPVAVAAAAFSVLFWLASPGLPGTAALSVIIPLCGIAAAAYVAFLATSMTAPDDASRQALFAQTRTLMFTKSLALAGAVLVLATWLLLVFRLPTLLPLGSGLVPALLAWLQVRGRSGPGAIPG